MKKTIYEIQLEEQRKKDETKMLRDHKRASKNHKLKPFPVKGDPCNTVFYCKTEERGKASVEKHTLNHKDYWK